VKTGGRPVTLHVAEKRRLGLSVQYPAIGTPTKGAAELAKALDLRKSRNQDFLPKQLDLTQPSVTMRSEEIS
jgi:hypothetical protein